jgi:hypothetical protein
MATQNNTIDQVKAWLTPGLLSILSWFVIDLKNDVKVLLDRTARLEERVQVIKETKRVPMANLIHFKGMDFIFDRNKIFTKLPQGYDYI